jgi:curved DNA-binding protein
MTSQDYYQLLGIQRSADEKQIRQAYRRLAREYHPDVNPGDTRAEHKFKEINEAYEVLSDPESREKYDQYGDQWRHADQFGARPRSRGFDPHARMGNSFDFDPGNLGADDIFGGLFGGGRRQPRKGEDIEIKASVTLEESYSGTARTVEKRNEQEAAGRSRRMEVSIPSGVRDGARIRISGAGRQGVSGGTPGDMYVIVTIGKHSRFERKGDDLHVQISVELVNAVLGAEVVVPTIKGADLALKIPPESQNGQVFRLVGQGMPRGDDEYGDLYAHLNVMLPVNLSEREQKLFEEMRELRLD